MIDVNVAPAPEARQRSSRSIRGNTGVETSAQRIRFWIVIAFVAVCALGGGSSRPDMLSLASVRVAAILCIVGLMMTKAPWHFPPFRYLWMLLSAFAAVIVIQLVPLPPQIWTALPGRGFYADGAIQAGLALPWRPISLTPDLTLNSALALLPVAAMLLGLAGLSLSQRQRFLPVLIILSLVSATLGIIQLGSGSRSPLYLYDVTHTGSAVGFFANRNHQAALLAMTFPLLRLWTLQATNDKQWQRTRTGLALALALFMIPVLLVTGSRAGLALGAVGMIVALLLSPLTVFRTLGSAGKFAAAGLLITPVILASIVLYFGRGVALDRLQQAEISTDARFELLPFMLDMTWAYFPVGSGFGSFDRVFRRFEPDSVLFGRYMNNAHNDLLEVLMTGGLPALCVLIAFLVWWGVRSWVAVAKGALVSPGVLFARVGAAMMLIAFGASLVDYPLRTPLMAVVFVIACVWLADCPRKSRHRAKATGDA